MVSDNEHFYIIKKMFKASTEIHYRAPYSLGDDVNLPEGLIIKLDNEPSNTDELVSACPVDYEAWEEVFALFDKGSRKYSGYSLLINMQDLLKYCERTHKASSLPKQLINIDAYQGCLLGTALGDSIGLPFEGLSRQRIQRIMKKPLNHQFLFGYGMVSDDTEHSCFVAQALIQSAGETQDFQKQLARRLKKWFLALPAGIGMATLKASIKLCLGFSPKKSGVFSAGNGPMMRAAILGVFAGDNDKYLQELIDINTRITHSDPKAQWSALMVARAAYLNANNVSVNSENFAHYFHSYLVKDKELEELMQQVVNSVKANQSTEEFCEKQGMIKGVSGYCYQSLPVVMHAYLTYPEDYEQAVSSVIRCGGDTDTVAAIVGGIIGARVGLSGLPERWLSTLKDWPCSVTKMQFLASELAYARLMKKSRYPADSFFPVLLIRNLLFMCIVLVHGFRRLLPPY